MQHLPQHDEVQRIRSEAQAADRDGWPHQARILYTAAEQVLDQQPRTLAWRVQMTHLRREFGIFLLGQGVVAFSLGENPSRYIQEARQMLMSSRDLMLALAIPGITTRLDDDPSLNAQYQAGVRGETGIGYGLMARLEAFSATTVGETLWSPESYFASAATHLAAAGYIPELVGNAMHAAIHNRALSNDAAADKWFKQAYEAANTAKDPDAKAHAEQIFNDLYADLATAETAQTAIEDRP